MKAYILTIIKNEKAKSKELSKYIESLKAQIALLSEQLTVKDNQINILTAEIEQERKERQTILMELLTLRGQPKITTAAADSKAN